MKKTVVVLMLLTILSKLLGFGRDIILSFFYGASNISDVFLISLTIPMVLITILGKGISAGFIPMYTRIESKEGLEKAHRYTNNIMNLVIVICTVILLVGLFFTEPIVKLFASGFVDETLELTVEFSRITLLGIYFIGLNYVYTAYLQLKGVFIVPSLLGIPANFLVIGSIYLSAITNAYALAVGNLIAFIVQFVLLFIFCRKNQFKYVPQLDIKDNNIRKMMVLAFPAMLGTSVAQINLLIDRTLASQIAVGGITALTYSSTLSVVIIGVFVLSINSVLYPKISRLCAENKIDDLKIVLTGAISAINILVMPAIVGMMILAEPIIVFLYGRGQFDSQAIAMTSSALFFYSIGIIGLSHREILSNTFYSLQDTKTPMINAAIAMFLNIVLNLVLSRYMGIGGLALASSISAIFCTLLLLINLKKRIGNLGLKNILSSFFKVLFASLVMGGVTKFIYSILDNHLGLTFSLIISVFLGASIYFVLIYVMRIKEINILVLEVKRRLKGSREQKYLRSLQ